MHIKFSYRTGGRFKAVICYFDDKLFGKAELPDVDGDIDWVTHCAVQVADGVYVAVDDSPVSLVTYTGGITALWIGKQGSDTWIGSDSGVKDAREIVKLFNAKFTSPGILEF